MKLPSFLYRLIFDQSDNYRFEAKVLIFWVLGLIASVIFIFLFSLPFSLVGATTWQHLAYIQGVVVGFFFATFISWFLLTKEKELELSTGLLDWKWFKSVKGFFVGVIIFSVFILVGFSFGWFEFEINYNVLNNGISPLGLFYAFTFFLLSVMAEELMFRGFPLQVESTPDNRIYRITCLSMIFCLMHGFNDNIGWLGFVNIFIAGVWLSFGSLAEKTVWYSFGLHFGWNLSQAFIFNFPNSGEVFFEKIFFIQTLSDPQISELLTGGKFGPEGSLITTLILILATIYEKRKLAV